MSQVRHIAAFVLAAASAVTADLRAELIGSYVVGSGAKSSHLQFEFSNSNTYLYEIRYDGTLRGSDLLSIAATAQPGFFSYQTVSFSFGDALFGVTIGSDTDSGFGTPPDYLDYWHYWTRESAPSAWLSSVTGFGDRIVADGSWDGWVFNSDAPPAAVPAPAGAAILAVGAALARRRR